MDNRLYGDDLYNKGLMFQEVFPDLESFREQVVSVGGITDIDELYELMCEKYMYSESRYQVPEALVLAIRRTCRVPYPAYLKQKELIEFIQNAELEVVAQGTRMLTNYASNPNDDQVAADEEPISNYSTAQESQLQQLSTYQAVKEKYYNVARDYVSQIYRALDPLFVQVLSDEVINVY